MTPPGAATVDFDTTFDEMSVSHFKDWMNELVITACCPFEIAASDIADAKDFLIWRRVANQYGSMAAGMAEFTDRPRVFFIGYWTLWLENAERDAHRDIKPYVAAADVFDLDRLQYAQFDDKSFVEGVYRATLEVTKCEAVAARFDRRPGYATYRDPDARESFGDQSKYGHVICSYPGDLTWREIANADEFVYWIRGALDGGQLGVGVAQFADRGLVFFLTSWR